MWLVVALAVAMMIFTIVSVTTFNRNDRQLFGLTASFDKNDMKQSVLNREMASVIRLQLRPKKQTQQTRDLLF